MAGDEVLRRAASNYDLCLLLLQICPALPPPIIQSLPRLRPINKGGKSPVEGTFSLFLVRTPLLREKGKI